MGIEGQHGMRAIKAFLAGPVDFINQPDGDHKVNAMVLRINITET
jgi:hypothetical protein